MRTIDLIIVFVCLGIFTNCNNNEDTYPGYPTSIEELSEEERSSIIEEINATSLAGATYIDLFGYPILDIESDSSLDSLDWQFDITKAELELMMKEAIVEYDDFINCTDSSLVSATGIATPTGISYDAFFEDNPDSLPPMWVVTSNLQTYDDLTVIGTNLSVLCSPYGVIGLGGHWYNEITVPTTDIYSSTNAMNSIIGTTFTYSSENITPSENSTWQTPKKIILPINYFPTIELHVCWALYPDNWEFFIDSQTGEVLTFVNFDEL